METADRNLVIYTGGKIFGGCGWDHPNWHEAVLVGDGIIRAVGDLREIESSHSGASVLDLDGALLLPGLCDAHLHLAVGGRTLTHPNLTGLNPPEIRDVLIEHFATIDASPDRWLKAQSWESWRGLIDSSFLDSIVQNRPLVVFSRDLHSCCCNSVALKAAGITSATPDPPGGIIVRLDNGILSGIMRDEAMGMILKAIPDPTPQELRSQILEAQDYIISLGLTAVSEILEPETESIYYELEDNDELLLQIDGWRRWDDRSVNFKPPPPGEKIKINTLKVFLDGAYGSRTAAISGSYRDDPENFGLLLYEDEELIEKLGTAVEQDWRVALHAIGDRAVSQACRVLRSIGMSPHGPHRVEHLQTLGKLSKEEFQLSRAVASVQPVHLLDDNPWLADRIGKEACRNSFIWNSLLKVGVTLAIGTDWPVASPDPLRNLHAAINRAGYGGEPTPDFDDAEALHPHHAIRSATYGWAVAAGLDSERGSIKPGNVADFTMVTGVDQDLTDWSQATAVGTIIGGVQFGILV